MSEAVNAASRVTELSAMLIQGQTNTGIKMMTGFSAEQQALNEKKWPALANKQWVPTSNTSSGVGSVWYWTPIGTATFEEFTAKVEIAFKKHGVSDGQYIVLIRRTSFPDKGETLNLPLDATKATFDEVVDAALTTAIQSLESRADQIRGAQARYKDAADTEIPYSVWTYPALKTMAWTRDESITHQLFLTTKLRPVVYKENGRSIEAPVTLIFQGYKYMLGEFCVIAGSAGEGDPGAVVELKVDPTTATLGEVVSVALDEALGSLESRFDEIVGYIDGGTPLDITGLIKDTVPSDFLDADSLKQAEDYLSKPVEGGVDLSSIKMPDGWVSGEFRLPEPHKVKGLKSKETSGKYFNPDYMVWDRLQEFAGTGFSMHDEIKHDSDVDYQRKIKADRGLAKSSEASPSPLSADAIDAVAQAFGGLDFSQPGQYTMDPLREPKASPWVSADFGEPIEIAKITLPKGAFWLSFEDMKANDPLNLTRFFPTIFGLRKDISDVIWWIGLKKLSNQISPFQGPKG